MNKIICVFLPFTMYFVIQCESIDNNRIKLVKYPDMYEYVFNNSGISSLVGESDLEGDFNDTLSFDRNGRLIKRVDKFSLSRWDYDSKGYKTRYLHQTDTWSNFVFEYIYTRDTLFEIEIPLIHSNWEYKKSDLNNDLLVESFYTLKNGRPTMYVSGHGFYELYEYSLEDKLISKKRFDIGNELIFEVNFKYKDDQLTRSILTYSSDSLQRIEYFDSGLLDSISHFDDLTKRYSVLEKY